MSKSQNRPLEFFFFPPSNHQDLVLQKIKSQELISFSFLFSFLPLSFWTDASPFWRNQSQNYFGKLAVEGGKRASGTQKEFSPYFQMHLPAFTFVNASEIQLRRSSVSENQSLGHSVPASTRKVRGPVHEECPGLRRGVSPTRSAVFPGQVKP